VRRALEARPNTGAYLDSLGWAYFRRGDLNEAEKYLGQAVDRMPDNSEVLDHMGDLHAARGRWQDAIDTWSRALSGTGDGIDPAAVKQKIDDARRRVSR
jgi:tetratricopeptide (TPR) repeat protein